MNSRLFFLSVVLFLSTCLCAQTQLKKVYDEQIDPLQQIDSAVKKAKTEGKFVICQVGGNWCPWCLRFADFVEKDSVISQCISDNFVYIHVNYRPKKKNGGTTPTSNNEPNFGAMLMQRLNHPDRFGFPVFVVLDGEGNVMHTQDSSFLEEGEGYSQEKVLRFFNNWTPKAVMR